MSYARGWFIPGGILVVGTISGVVLYGKFKSGELSLGAGKLEVEIAQKETKLGSLEKRLSKAKERLAKYIEMEEEAEMFAVMNAELKELREGNAAGKGRLDSLKEGLEQTAGMFDDYKQRYRRHVRAKAVGTKMDQLTTLEGRTYHRVEIKSVGALGINITHRDGSGRIPFQELPQDMQRQFQFDEEEAEAQQRREEELRRKRQLALAAAENAAQQTDEPEDEEPDEPKMSEAERDRAIAKLRSAIKNLEDRLFVAQANLNLEKKKTVSRAPQYRAEIRELQAAIKANEALLRELKSRR